MSAHSSRHASASVATLSCIVGTFLTALAANLGTPWLHFVTPWITGFIIWYAPFVQTRALAWQYKRMIAHMRQELATSGLDNKARMRISQSLKEAEEVSFEIEIALLPTDEDVKGIRLRRAALEEERNGYCNQIGSSGIPQPSQKAPGS